MKHSIVKNIFVSVATLASVGVTTQSVADGNWYVGAAVSQAFIDERGLDEDDTGGKVFGGYRFNDFISIEGAYYDFGEISERDSQLEIDGISLAVVGSIPVTSKLSIYGKAGAHDWDVESTGLISNQLDEDSDSDAFYGIGVGYMISDRWRLQVEVERYEVDELDIDTGSIGFVVNF